MSGKNTSGPPAEEALMAPLSTTTPKNIHELYNKIDDFVRRTGIYRKCCIMMIYKSKLYGEINEIFDKLHIWDSKKLTYRVTKFKIKFQGIGKSDEVTIESDDIEDVCDYYSSHSILTEEEQSVDEYLSQLVTDGIISAFNSRSNTPSREKRGGFHLKKINQLYGRETRHRRKKEYDYDSRLKKRSRFKRVKGKNRL